MASPFEVFDKLDAVIDELGAVDTDTLDAKTMLAWGRRVERVTTRLEARGLDVLADLDERGVWALDAAYNLANWVASQTGTSKTDAGWRARIAGLLRLLPATAEAYRDGRITFAHVHLMAKCLGPRTREYFDDEAEAMLVELALAMTADDFATEVRQWIDVHDSDGPEPPAEGDRDELWASRTLGGRVLGKFNLGEERGTEFLAALDEKVDELYRRDQANAEVDPTDGGLNRPAANRRAQALTELVAQGSAAGTSGARRGPAFWIMLDAATAAGEVPDDPADELHQLTDGTYMPRRLIQQWLCDSEIARMVLGVAAESLRLGRTVRTANPTQRRAMAARDHGCAVPGCDRPPNWCHAHHITWWSDGGNTDIDNLCLLCTHHHRRVHAQQLTVKIVDGQPRFWNRYGDELTHRRRTDAA